MVRVTDPSSDGETGIGLLFIQDGQVRLNDLPSSGLLPYTTYTVSRRISGGGTNGRAGRGKGRGRGKSWKSVVTPDLHVPIWRNEAQPGRDGGWMEGMI